jgi:putative FmdB family regulatory protein
MPTYEYECPKCGHRFEKFQGINDPPVKTCPKCRGRKVKRLIGTGAGILFKGSGFYLTDYRSDGYKKAAKAETESKGDAKPAAKEGAGKDGKGAKKPETKAAPSKPSKKEKGKG